MRLPAQPGERIDRAETLGFSFAGRRLSGFAGDTIGSALFASGRRVFSRSFKYHRPRGLLCANGGCPNCLMTVDGVPNVRVCVEPLREGAVVQAQNVLGSLERDWLSVVDRFGAPFTPVGFYYRTMIRPRRAWPLYERALRSAAGLGSVAKRPAPARRYDAEHRRVDVLVIGGGRSGRRAAAEAAAGGARVLLVDQQGPAAWQGVDPERGYELLAPALALGIYEGGLVPVDAGAVLYRIRAGRIVVAAGAIEQPLVFPENDLVGVMLPSAVRRLVREWSLRPGSTAVVVGADDRSLALVDDLERSGVRIAAAVDLRSQAPARIGAQGRRGQLRSVTIDGRVFDCDLLVASGALQPATSLLAQSGGRVAFEPRRGILVPSVLAPGVEAVGRAAAELPDGALTSPSYGSHGHGKSFVCVCEDVTEGDLGRAVAEGFDSIELAKRYTTVTMGPCQGRLCQLSSIRILARELGREAQEIGTTTARPPWTPVELGLLAGRHHEPTKRSPLDRCHELAGATMMWTGAWRRPLSYGDELGEVRAVHASLGVIDVSTLGKLVVEGPGAVEFLERLYPSRFGGLASGRVRYAVLTSDGGRILDDGTVARLGPELFYLTTTSTGAEAVTDWLEWWNAIWRYDLEIVDLTGALGAVNLAGPRAREVLERLTGDDVSAAAFPYLGARELSVAGVPCLAMRVGFVGELGYELHCPADAAPRLWEALLDQGAVPFGLEAQRVLRLEKGHLIVGQDTDSETTLLSAGLAPKLAGETPDFVGGWALEHLRAHGARERLVGFTMAGGALPPEGAQIVRDGKLAGRVTSARRSELLGHIVGLAWVEADRAEEGASLEVRIDGALIPAQVTLAAFHDPAGSRVRA